MGGTAATHRQKSPSRDGSSNLTTDRGGSDTDWLDQGSVGEGSSHSHDGDVVGQTSAVVFRVVDDQVALVTDSSAGEQMCSNDHGNSIISEILSAMGSGQNPARTDDGRSAEVVSVGTTEGSQVRELARSSVHSTDDTGLDGWKRRRENKIVPLVSLLKNPQLTCSRSQSRAEHNTQGSN